MKLSLNWLKDYVDIKMSPGELDKLLTMAGLEIEGIEPAGQSLNDIIVARILSIKPHPGKAGLSICEVDTCGDVIKVVCGAPNLEKGMLAPLALPGVKLPDGTVIKESRIKGELSTGVLLAEDEIGLTDDHAGIMALPSNLKPGEYLPSAMPMILDWVFDVSITPNRPDCACVLGIAREIAAITGQPLEKPEIKIRERGPNIEGLTNVTIVDPAGCPRYAAGVIQNIDLRPSPFWMRYRLFLSEIRSINNIVDITNYVMLEIGQPLHAFDYNRLKENRIVVRRANKGEVFSTLDGEEHTLDSETLMICDGERAVALAGIMGGLNSEICAGTKNVLLESAFFDPVTIRRGSKRTGISTEASYRFERGSDIGGVATALKRAMGLMAQLSGGEIAGSFIDNYPDTYTPPDINLRINKTNRILGTTIPKDVIMGYLTSLDMEIKDIDENNLRVIPPSFRVDISREADLIEEVARLNGYDNIPVTYPSVRPSKEGNPPEIILRDVIRPVMAGIGFTEIINYSFISPDSVDMLGAGQDSYLKSFVRLLNPLTVDQSVMRTSLIPGLLTAVNTNIPHDKKDLKLFEWGKIFIHKEGDQQPLEKNFLAAIMTGPYHQKTWYCEDRPVDFYDIKGAVEVLLKAIGLQGVLFQKDGNFPGYDKEISSGIYHSNSLIGQIGRVSAGVMEAYDLVNEQAFLFELDIAALLAQLPKTRKFIPFAKFPAVYRDISILVNSNIESGKIMEIIRKRGEGLVESIQLFDLYQGKRIDSSEKAIALRVSYRSGRETLDGTEVNRLHEAIIEKIRQETGGRLREG